MEPKGFALKLDDNNSIEFESSNLSLRFYHNKYENSIGYFLKHKDLKTAFENHIVEEFLGIKYEPVFGLHSKLEYLSLWVEQRKSYFTKNERAFLDGDLKLYQSLNEFLERKSDEYIKRFT